MDPYNIPYRWDYSTFAFDVTWEDDYLIDTWEGEL
jgi:hypothetical protein